VHAAALRRCLQCRGPDLHLKAPPDACPGPAPQALAAGLAGDLEVAARIVRNYDLLHGTQSAVLIATAAAQPAASGSGRGGGLAEVQRFLASGGGPLPLFAASHPDYERTLLGALHGSALAVAAAGWASRRSMEALMTAEPLPLSGELTARQVGGRGQAGARGTRWL